MEEIILKAIKRDEESPKKIRAAGFVPGVLNESDGKATSVKFEAPALNKIITKHGSNAKLWIKYGNKKKFGYIMEIQKRPLGAEAIHISIKLINADEEIKMKLPIIYQGREALGSRTLQLNISKSEIEVQGKATLLPDTVVCDVSAKELDDIITANDFNLPEEINVLDADNEVYAVVKIIHEKPIEEPEAAEAEEASEEQAAKEEQEEAKPAE